MNDLGFARRPFVSHNLYQSGWSWADFVGAYGVVVACVAVICACIVAVPWVFTRSDEGRLPGWMAVVGGLLSVALAITAYVVFWRMLGPIGEHLPAQTYRGKIGALIWWIIIVASGLLLLAVLTVIRLFGQPSRWLVIVVGCVALFPSVGTTVDIAVTGIPILGNGLTVFALVIIVLIGLAAGWGALQNK